MRRVKKAEEKDTKEKEKINKKESKYRVFRYRTLVILEQMQRGWLIQYKS